MLNDFLANRTHHFVISHTLSDAIRSCTYLNLNSDRAYFVDENDESAVVGDAVFGASVVEHMTMGEHHFDHSVADPLAGDDIKWDVHGSEYREENHKVVEEDKDVLTGDSNTGKSMLPAVNQYSI
jgi:hypothetical protein